MGRIMRSTFFLPIVNALKCHQSRLMAFVLMILIGHRVVGQPTQEKLISINEEGYRLCQQGHFQAAFEYLDQVNVAGALQVSDSVSAFTAYLLGFSLDRLGKGEASVAWHQQAIDWRSKNFEAQHPELLQSHLGIGDAWRYALKSADQAIPLPKPSHTMKWLWQLPKVIQWRIRDTFIRWSIAWQRVIG